MTRLSITMPDPIAERVKEAGGDNVSGWLTRLARQEFIRQEMMARAAWDREHRDPRDEAEDEAEREYARAVERGV